MNSLDLAILALIVSVISLVTSALNTSNHSKDKVKGRIPSYEDRPEDIVGKL